MSENVGTVVVTLDDAILVATGVTTKPRAAGLYNLTGKIHANGGAILCFVGPPFRTVEWKIVSGAGTVTPFTLYTDAQGRASARFEAAIPGPVVVGVTWIP